MIQNREYPPNSIGYHRQRAEKIFGEASAPVLWLDEQAELVDAGYDEQACMREDQVIAKLQELHHKELENEDDPLDEEELEE